MASNRLGKLLFALLPALMLLTAGTATAFNSKKTVCTVTINSSDEADSFKRHFNSNSWDFVELTDGFTGDSNNWFEQACEKKVKCDILIVSGHFGGTFFGESDLRLSMEDLEAASCSKKCSGIVKQPKEVFLFGCNTLASKTKDTRTPEDYHRVLIQDGFSHAQASQIVAFRYSQLGDSFKKRMTDVFAKTPRIYGFSALAPSGVTTKPLLDNYLVRAAAFYSDFDRRSVALNTKPNTALQQSFRSTTLAQASGASVASGSGGGSQSIRPYCYLQDEARNRNEKLDYIYHSLKSGQSFATLPHIARFVRSEGSDFKPLNEEEEVTVQKIAADDSISKDLGAYLKLPGDVYLPVRVNILNLMKNLRVIDRKQYASRVSEALGIDFKKPIPRLKADAICSLDLQADILLEQIPEARWQDEEFFALLQCLRPQNVDLLKKVVEVMLYSPVEFLRYSAGVVVGKSQTKNLEVLDLVAGAMIKHTNEGVRTYAATQLGESRTNDIGIQKQLAHAMLNDSSYHVRHAAAAALSDLRPTASEIQLSLVQSLLNKNEEYGVHEYAAHALRRSVISDPHILQHKALWE